MSGPDRAREPGTRRIVSAVAGTAAGLVLLLGYHTSLGGAATSAPGGTRNSGSTGSSGSGSSSPSSGASTVTGDSVSTRWGPVQVQISVSGGKIAEVTAVVYPANNPHDQQINGYALPILREEALAAQSADIDLVSGATVTSEGYIGSLQSALDQANL